MLGLEITDRYLEFSRSKIMTEIVKKITNFQKIHKRGADI